MRSEIVLPGSTSQLTYSRTNSRCHYTLERLRPGDCYFGDKPKEENMPVFVVPLLVGLPIVVGGGWVIYKVVAG